MLSTDDRKSFSSHFVPWTPQSRGTAGHRESTEWLTARPTESVAAGILVEFRQSSGAKPPERGPGQARCEPCLAHGVSWAYRDSRPGVHAKVAWLLYCR